jgi:hypothetical protein
VDQETIDRIPTMPVAELLRLVRDLAHTFTAHVHRLHDEERQRFNTEIGWPNDPPVNLQSFGDA